MNFLKACPVAILAQVSLRSSLVLESSSRAACMALRVEIPKSGLKSKSRPSVSSGAGGEHLSDVAGEETTISDASRRGLAETGSRSATKAPRRSNAQLSPQTARGARRSTVLKAPSPESQRGSVGSKAFARSSRRFRPSEIGGDGTGSASSPKEVTKAKQRRNVVFAHHEGDHEVIEMEQTRMEEHEHTPLAGQFDAEFFSEHDGEEDMDSRRSTLLSQSAQMQLIDDMRVAIEAYQGTLQLEELFMRPEQWEPESGRVRPYLQYFHRALRKVLVAGKVNALQEKAQKGIVSWIITVHDSKDKMLPKSMQRPKTREEIIDSISRTQFFWDQMRSAHVRGVKLTQAVDSLSQPFIQERPTPDRPVSANRRHWPEMLANSVDMLDSDTLRDDLTLKLEPWLRQSGADEHAGLVKIFSAQEDKEYKAQWLQHRRRQGSQAVSHGSFVYHPPDVFEMGVNGQSTRGSGRIRFRPSVFAPIASAGQNGKRGSLHDSLPDVFDRRHSQLNSKKRSASPRQRTTTGRRAVVLGCSRMEEHLWADMHTESHRPLVDLVASPTASTQGSIALPTSSPHGSFAISTPQSSIASPRISAANSPRRSLADAPFANKVNRRVPASATEIYSPEYVSAGAQEQSQEQVQVQVPPDGTPEGDLCSRSSTPGLPVSKPVFCWGEGSLSTQTACGINTLMVAEYLKAHMQCQAVPVKQGVFVMSSEDNTFVDLASQQLDDDCLTSLVPTLVARKRNAKLEGISLQHNNIVDGVRDLCRGIGAPPRRDILDRISTFRMNWLDLSNNPLSTVSVKSLADALRKERLSVRRLHLCSMPLTAEGLEDLCAAIVETDAVNDMALADTHCGRHRQDMCSSVAQLCLAVEKLDISQNYFRQEGLESLGAVLAISRANVTHLALSENTWAVQANVKKHRLLSEATREVSPMLHFCEALGNNASLLALDLSGSQLDSEAAICLEDSLTSHPCLANLDISQNPLGVDGLRAILRAVVDPNACLAQLRARELRRSAKSGTHSYNPMEKHQDYTGSQALRLTSPYHRAKLRLLLRRAASLGEKASASFQHFTLNGDRGSLTFKRSPHGRLLVPMDGTAEFLFDAYRKVEHTSASSYVSHVHRQQRLPVGMVKFVSILRLFKELHQDDQKTCVSTEHERQLFLLAATQDLQYSSTQVKLLIDEIRRRSPAFVADVVSHFGATIERPDRYFCISAFRLEDIYMEEVSERVHKRRKLTFGNAYRHISSLVRLNLDSLTGHHEFDLSLPTGYCAAQRALIAIKWEIEVAEKKHMIDYTELGGYAGFRNLTLDGAHVNYTTEWSLETCGSIGCLAFDYITPLLRREPTTLRPLPQAHFSQLADFLSAAGTSMTPEACFQCLWSMVHHLLICAHQLEVLLETITGYQGTKRWCVEFYVMLFPRCVDFGAPLNDQFKGVLAVGDHFEKVDVQAVRKRIGIGNTFDVLNVHRKGINRFAFDLSKRDERLCLHAVLAIKNVESGSNLRECRYSELGALCQIGTWSIPATWSEEMPITGHVSFTYVCQEQHVRNGHRKEIAIKHFGWMETTAEH